MVWPFGRKKTRTASADTSKAWKGPLGPRDAGADAAVLADIDAWLDTHASDQERTLVPDAHEIHLGHPPDPTTLTVDAAPAGAVLKIKRGKLAWVDLYDPSLRPTVDALVKHLDKQQRWYFNGVISSKYIDA